MTDTHKEKLIKLRKTRMERMFPIDSKIILINNHPSSNPAGINYLQTGWVTGFTTVGTQIFVNWTNSDPNNHNEKNTHEFMTFNDPIPYSLEIYMALSKLDWDERWNIYNKGMVILTKEDKHRKENQLKMRG